MSTRSYRSPLRSAAAAQTRARIVAAAAKLLRQRGIEEFSLESVGKFAGITRLTVYNHFGSRRALLEEVFDDRAARGGLHRIPEAMTEPDPHIALDRLIAIFCKFWGFDPRAIARLHGVGGSDAEFEDVIRTRNERRRRIFSVLVGRLIERGEVRAEAAADLTDMLFVLTSFTVFAELSRGRSKDAACSLVQSSAEDAVNRAGV